MFRVSFFLAALVTLGCAATGDRPATNVVVIPDDPTASDYNDLLPKLRNLAWNATEAFYRDRWDELDQSATAIDRAVKALRQTRNVPVRVAPDLASRCESLSKECQELKSAAAARSPDQASDRLQKIHVLVRELRSES